MDSSNPGAGDAFIDKHMSRLAKPALIFNRFCARVIGTVRARRPTLETVKTIISVSLDLTRTALACIAAAQDWGQPSTA